MQPLSPTFNYPKTPAHNRNPLQYRPLNSSPLVGLSENQKSSPVAAAQARRKSQYKAQFPTTPLNTRSVTNTRHVNRRLFSSNNHGSASPEGDPQKAFLRDRLKAKCLERAVRAREKAIRGKRYGSMSEPSSDDYRMEDDESEDEEDIMQDELFRRIMANANRKTTHAYRVSYAQEVGSSFDPDMEDISRWEEELAAVNSAESEATLVPAGPNSAELPPSDFQWLEDSAEDLTPADLDDEELLTYAEECAQRAALEDLEGIPVEDLFGWDDGEDFACPNLPRQDETMDVS